MDRRFLIAAGTARYDHLREDEQLPSVCDDLTRLVGCFERCGYERVLAELGNNPSANELRQALGDWFADDSRRSADVVILYYAGHGERVEGDGHYLAARDTRYKGTRLLTHTALAEEELAKPFAGSPVQHALVILDTCYAEAGIMGFSKKAVDVFDTRRWTASHPRGIHLIAAARGRQLANDGAFVPAFCRAVENARGQLGGAMQAFIAPLSLVTTVNVEFKRTGVRQEAAWTAATPLADDRIALVPNRRFERGRPAGMDVTEHWLPKASGGEPGSEAWYFTGREQALRELVVWLALPASDRKARVLTGGPGAGKSAVLGRLVLLADPDQRARLQASGALAGVAADTVPELRVIDVSVHARGKTLAEVTNELGEKLALESTSPRELLKLLELRQQRLTVVVDALDESIEPAKLARELLRPMTMMSAVKLLVGSRPDGVSEAGKPRVRALAGSAVEIDLDDQNRYLGHTDVENYVTRRLLAADEPGRHTPYRGQADLARMVGRAVAERARGVFLVARMVSRTLVDSAGPIDVTASHWSELLPGSISEAFENFLGGFDGRMRGGLERETVIDLLRPLAFSFGAGLPRDDLWSPLAGAIRSGEAFDPREDSWRLRYVDEDVAGLLAHAGAYVVEALEDEGSRYRLYHEALAELLRADTDQAGTHARIGAALAILTEERGGWEQGHAYPRRHLPAHVSAGGRQDELARVLLDWNFVEEKVKQCGIDAMLTDFRGAAELRASQPSVEALYRLLDRSAHHLRWRASLKNPALFAQQIYLQALILNLPFLAERAKGRLTQLGQPHIDLIWRAGPAVGALERTLSGHTDSVHAVAITADGRYAVSGSNDRTVKIWDLDSGQEIRTLVGHDGWIHALAITADCKRIVSGSYDRTLKVWDLETGDLEQTLHGHEGLVLCVAISPDGRFILSGAQDSAIEVWDLPAGRHAFTLHPQPGQPMQGGQVDAVAFTPDGRFAVSSLASLEKHSLQVWDLARRRVTRRLRGHKDNIQGIDIAADPPLVIGACLDGSLVVWNFSSGKLKQHLRGHKNFINSVELLPGGRHAVSASTDGTLKVWDLERGKDIDTLAGHSSSVTAVAVTPDGKRAVSASYDGTLNVWRLQFTEAAVPRVGHEGAVVGIAVTPAGDRMVSASDDCTLRITDPATGQLHRALRDRNGWMGALTLTPDGRYAIASSSSSRNAMKIWDLAARRSVRRLVGHTGAVRSVAVTPDGRRVLSGSNDNTVRVWDFESGRQIATLPMRQGHVQSLRVAEVGAYAISALDDGTYRIWDLSRLSDGAVLGPVLTVAGCHPALPVPKTLPTTSSGPDPPPLEALIRQRVRQGDLRSVAVTPDGRRGVSVTRDGQLIAWDVRHGDAVPGAERYYRSAVAVAITPDGRRVFYTDPDGTTLGIWDLAPDGLRMVHGGNAGVIQSIAVDAQGQRAVGASSDGTLIVWDLHAGGEVSLLAGHEAPVNAVVLTRDGRTAISGASDRTLKIWELESGDLRRTLTVRTPVAALALADDGDLFYSASASRIDVWSWPEGQPITHALLEGAVQTMAVVPRGDGRIVAGDSVGNLYCLRLERARLNEAVQFKI